MALGEAKPTVGCIWHIGALTCCGRTPEKGEFCFHEVVHAINCYDSRTNKIARGGLQVCHECVDCYKVKQAKEDAERAK
jgi:hypothetical protein